MGETCCRIERLTNGYEVEMRDPVIVKKNKARDGAKGPCVPWQDPMKSFVFKDVDEVLKFLKKNLSKALPDDGTETSFDHAFATASEKDDD